MSIPKSSKTLRFLYSQIILGMAPLYRIHIIDNIG